MKAVIYARYSSERQTEQSIEGQLRECYEFAEHENIEVVGEYIDRALSGTTDHRPDFQRMIADSKSRDFNAVIVYKLDRFARNRYDSAVYKAKLKANGVKVLSAKERITDSPEGIILEGLLEAMNEYYSAELSQKVKRGMRENVLKGKSIGGKIALGYRVGADKHFEIDEAGAAVVRYIFSEYDSGKTFAEICNALNSAGHTTARGNQFRSDSLSRILANRKYIGEYSANGIDAASECPAIVDKEVFERVQKRLAEHLQKHRHNKNPRHDYLLTGLLTCGECGENLSGTSGTSKTGKRHYYYAGRKNCHGKIHADELEDAVVNAVTDFLTEENCVEIAHKAYELYEKERNENPELDAAKKELASVNTKLQNAMDALMSGFKSTTLQETVADMEKRKANLEKEILRLNKKAPAFKPEHFEYFIQKYKTFKQNENDRRSLIETFVNRIIVYPDKAVILINLTDNTKTPPLQQITAALERCSDNGEIGGSCASQIELIYISPNVIGIHVRI